MTATLGKLSRIAHWSFWMVERVLVIDAGETATLIIVAERVLGEIQVRHHVSIPVSLGAPDQLVPETIAELQSEYAPIRIILIVPQSETVSQKISLTDVSIETFVDQEASRFQEIEGNPPVVDHQQLKDEGDRAYWLTYCQPNVIEQRLKQLGLALNEIDDVTSAAQGFWGFFESQKPASGTAFVIDVGRRHTSIMGIRDGKPSFATSFASTLQESQGSPSKEALAHWFQRLEDAPGSLHGLSGQTLQFDPNHQIILAGDDNLLDPIESTLSEQTKTTLEFVRSHDEQESTPGEFSIALGVARASLGTSSLHISLLPTPHRTRRDQRILWGRLRAWTTLLALVTILLLGIGTWQKFTLFQFKNELLSDTNLAIDKMKQTERTLSEFALQYESVRPILRFQQKTSELIETLTVLGQHCQDPSFWLVLLADTDTYVMKSNSSTNAVDETPIPQTNRLNEQPGYVAEFSFMDEGEPMRSKLTTLVEQLNGSGVFANVDTLPEDVRRPLANPKVVLTNRHAALSFQRHRNYFDRRLTIDQPSPESNEGSENASSFTQRNETIAPPPNTP